MTDTAEILQRWIRARGSTCNGFNRPEHVVRTADLRAYLIDHGPMFVVYCAACALRRGIQ